MKILIIGGCFTTQHNIEFSRLYHQSLKKKMIDYTGQPTEINTIRYERIGKTLEKISDFHKAKDFDLLIFHLRTEPFMRLVKLYYKYINESQKQTGSLNLPFLNHLMSEKHDVLEQRRINISNSSPEKKMHFYLRELNYHLGRLVGNKRKALKMYEGFLNEIVEYCHKQNKDLLVLGPASRPFSQFENRLSSDISDYFGKYSKDNKINYLELIGEKTGKQANMFFPNGQHVSQEGHDEVADKIFINIKNHNK